VLNYLIQKKRPLTKKAYRSLASMFDSELDDVQMEIVRVLPAKEDGDIQGTSQPRGQMYDRRVDDRGYFLPPEGM